jgi:hypothetical protein
MSISNPWTLLESLCERCTLAAVWKNLGKGITDLPVAGPESPKMFSELYTGVSWRRLTFGVADFCF